MAAPTKHLRPILRWTRANSRDALEALIIAGAGSVMLTNGRQLISGSANGKSFSYAVPSDLTPSGLVAEMEYALTFWDAKGAPAVDTFLATLPASRTVARFATRGGSDCFPHTY